MELDELLKETRDLRARIYKVWKAFEEKRISIGEAKVHISLTRTILENRRVEIAALYLSQNVQMPPAALSGRPRSLPREQ